MSEVIAELKALKLYGMAQSYGELLQRCWSRSSSYSRPAPLHCRQDQDQGARAKEDFRSTHRKHGGRATVLTKNQTL